MFGSFVRDRAFARTPNALEVFPREQSQGDVGAHNHQRADDGTPNMEDIHPPEGAFRNRRSEVEKHPTGNGEAIHHEEENEIAHLLAAVVTTLRRNFNRTKRDLEETTRVTAEIAEPLDRIHIPSQQGIQRRSETMRSEHQVTDQVKGIHNGNPDVPNHQIVSGFIGEVAEIDSRAGEQQCKPRHRINSVEYFVSGVES